MALNLHPLQCGGFQLADSTHTVELESGYLAWFKEPEPSGTFLKVSFLMILAQLT